MSTYHRPDLPPMVFHDEAGKAIEYGNRWRGGAPPEDSYSRLSNAERFAPLHAVAEALITHLCERYRATAREGSSPQGERTVDIVPEDPDAAAVSFGFTGFPGVTVRVGERFERYFPCCGCDACDETWETMADELEPFVLMGVENGFAGFAAPPRKPWQPWA